MFGLSAESRWMFRRQNSSLSQADSGPADRFTPLDQTRPRFQSLGGETGQNRQQNSGWVKTVFRFGSRRILGSDVSF